MILAAAVLCSIVLWTHCLNYTDVRPQQDFDLEQFGGEWYRVGLAYESPSFLKYKDRMLISKGYLLARENGSVKLSMWTMTRPKNCFSYDYEFEKTDVPGLFTYFSQRHKMVKDVTVVETNYTDYGVVLKYKNMNKDYTQVALYGRTPVLSQEVKEKFRSFALSLGFSVESIITPAKLDPCPLPQPRNSTEATV